MVFNEAPSQQYHSGEYEMFQLYAGTATISIVLLLLEIASQNDARCNRTACYFISFGLAGACTSRYTNDMLLQFLCALAGAVIAIGISRIIRKKSSREMNLSELDEGNRQL